MLGLSYNPVGASALIGPIAATVFLAASDLIALGLILSVLLVLVLLITRQRVWLV